MKLFLLGGEPYRKCFVTANTGCGHTTVLFIWMDCGKPNAFHSFDLRQASSTCLFSFLEKCRLGMVMMGGNLQK